MHRIICGNAVEVLKDFPSESVDMVFTSPPYYGLRDYGEDTEVIWRKKKDSFLQFWEKIIKILFLL